MYKNIYVVFSVTVFETFHEDAARNSVTWFSTHVFSKVFLKMVQISWQIFQLFVWEMPQNWNNIREVENLFSMYLLHVSVIIFAVTI